MQRNKDKEEEKGKTESVQRTRDGRKRTKRERMDENSKRKQIKDKEEANKGQRGSK